MAAAAALAFCGPLLGSAALPELARDARAWKPTEVEPGRFPKHVRDPRGALRVLRAPPERIVSSVLAADEILLELVPKERLAGITYLIDDATSTVATPPAGVARVKGAVEPTLALEPDLVFVADYTSSGVSAQLMAAGAAVIRLHSPSTFEGVRQNIELVGRAVGAEPAASALAADVSARLGALPRPRVSPRVLVWGFGNTYGAGCLQDDMIARAGGRNLAGELGLRGVSPLSAERVVVLHPDLVIVTTPDSAPRWGARDRLSGPAWDAVPAVRRGQVLALPAAWLSSVSHHAVLAAEAMAEAFAALPSAGGT